jgi:hypothetical protein
MTFSWRYLDASGADAGTSERFTDRGGAEEWLATAWPDLRARGVASVVLVEDGGESYRMSLADPGA